MTKRQIQKIHCGVRRGVNRLYRSYLISVLHDMRPRDRAGDVDRAIAAVSSFHRAPAIANARPPVIAHDIKLQADRNSARLRERLWRVLHLQLDLCATDRP